MTILKLQYMLSSNVVMKLLVTKPFTVCHLPRLFITSHGVRTGALGHPKHFSVLSCRLARIIIARNGPQITLNDIKNLLAEHNIGFEEGYTCLVLDCHFCCSRRHRGNLFINMTTGSFLCLKCGSCGSWDDFSTWISISKLEKNAPLPRMTPGSQPLTKEAEETLKGYKQATPVESLGAEEFFMMATQFGLEGIGVSVFKYYDARISSNHDRLLLPIYSVTGHCIGVHLISPKDESHSTNVVETIPGNLAGVLFGWKQLNKRNSSVIITGSPLGVLAVAQQMGHTAVSLPDPKSLPLEVLPLLEPFKKVVLWLGNSLAAWDSSKVFARKLNERRCFFIRPQDSNPEPLDAVKKDIKISGILKNLHPISHKAITTFNTLRKDVFAEFSQKDQIAGVKWKRYPVLSRLLKGHRRGELTVFTGQTGSGKTTFMSEYSLDLCIQGVRTLWGSFEIRNSRLAKTMLTQFSEIALDKHLDLYDVWADRFERLPLYFLTFHGPQSIRGVLDAMRHAVYVHDIEHVIVDNLQFMMGSSETMYGMDRFWKQDMIVSSFRQFSTVYNCHMTIVIHPRKENDDELTNMSIFGGAKACQEADNVLILQDKRLRSLRGRKYVQVTKNRFDGELGIVPLEFDKETLSFSVKKRPKKHEKQLNDQNSGTSTVA